MIMPNVRCDELGNREVRWNGVCRHREHRYQVPFVHPMAAQQLAEQCPCRGQYTLIPAAAQLLATHDHPVTTTSDERCPGCGQSDGLRWVDRPPDANSFTCRHCGTEWTITVSSPQPR